MDPRQTELGMMYVNLTEESVGLNCISCLHACRESSVGTLSLWSLHLKIEPTHWKNLKNIPEISKKQDLNSSCPDYCAESM
jgi:hypothetical protein